jgi:hypothetical protein
MTPSDTAAHSHARRNLGRLEGRHAAQGVVTWRCGGRPEGSRLSTGCGVKVVE